MWTLHLRATLLCRTSFAISIKLHQYFSFQLNSHHSQQEKTSFASSFTVFIQLLRTVKLKYCSVPQDEGMARNNSPWNRLAVCISAALCILPGSNSYTPLTSPASTHLTCPNSCSEVSAVMRTDAVTHCTGCMQTEAQTAPRSTLLQAKPL